MNTAPLLSIGIIFKNEERCIERCLKSLQPLRDAVPCELVMADTGAADGSRAIAERYADEVFDFAWIDDFAAARNAVMDRCHGRWYLFIDCDEWLDEDISELLAFLQDDKKMNFAFVTVRNYQSAGLEQTDSFSDFLGLRMVRMATGARFEGVIHESWVYSAPYARLRGVVLHHDGYVYANPEEERKKDQRNLPLLRKELEKNPDDLRTLLHCTDSSRRTPDHLQYVRQAVKVVQAKRDKWQKYGGVVLRNAVAAAQQYELLPELEEWAAFAHKTFPDSLYVRVDLNYAAFVAAHDAKRWEKAAEYGEAYRKGLRDFRNPALASKFEAEWEAGALQFAYPDAERTLLIGLADTYCQLKQGQKALQTLAALDGERFDAGLVRNHVVALCRLHAQADVDVSPVFKIFYSQIGRPTPGEAAKKARLAAFDTVAAAAFTAKYRAEEQKEEGCQRPAYTAFAALADVCEAGRGAAILMSADPEEMRGLLARVENWQALPIEALEYALQEGAAFPLQEKPLPLEVLDGLAARMTHGKNLARQLALSLPQNGGQYPGLQSMAWAQALAMAAVRSFDWTLGKKDEPISEFACPEKPKEQLAENEPPEDTPEAGLALLRAFAGVESAALPLLYTPQLLSEENAALLPPMHRWGFYSTRAFAALDAGQPQEYLAALRKGLAACPGQKEAVQFLLDRFKEQEHSAARPEVSPELEALAQKVRAILAAYGPDHPAARAIRESEAYKQVAWLIEDEGLPVQ